MADIIHGYPHYKELLKYPYQKYNKSDIAKAHKMLNDADIMEKCNKLKHFINPLTNRKLKPTSKIYKKIRDNYKICNMWPDELIAHDSTKNYLKQYDMLCKMVDEENKILHTYNRSVEDAILQIDKLNTWDEYVIFNGEKYGLSRIVRGIHAENDCGGTIILEKTEGRLCECRLCESWGGCGKLCNDINYYKCSNCDYKYSG